MTELPIVVNMTVDTSRTDYDLTAESNLEEIELLNDTVIETGGSHVPVYEGPYTVDAGLNAVTLDTDGKRLTQDVTVNALTENSVSMTDFTVASNTGIAAITSTVTRGYSPTAKSATNTVQLPTQARATITPTTSEQTAVAKGKYTTGIVKVRAIPTGTAGTPTATKGAVSNHSVSVTPSVTNTTGYIMGGTINGTAISVSASELVSGSLNITTNNTYDVTNYASAVVNVAGVSGYTITNNLTNITTNNATTEIVANQPYYAVLSVNSGYIYNSNCVVTMGNTDITSTAFDSTDMSITIASVTGNVVITATADVQREIPPEYQEVEYVRSAGVRYINTGLTLSNNEIRLYAKLYSTGKGSYGSNPMAVRAGTNSGQLGPYISFGKNGNVYTIGTGNGTGNATASTTQGATDSLLNVLIEINGTISAGQSNEAVVTNSYTINGVTDTVTSTGKSFNNGMRTVCLWGNYAKASGTTYKGRIYGFKIWDNNVKVLDIVPCYHISNGTVGVYDLVSQTFMSSSNNTSLTKGADVGGLLNNQQALSVLMGETI